MIFRKFREGFKKSAKYCLLSNWHDFLHEFIILGQIPVPQSRGGGHSQSEVGHSPLFGNFIFNSSLWGRIKKRAKVGSFLLCTCCGRQNPKPSLERFSTTYLKITQSMILEPGVCENLM